MIKTRVNEAQSLYKHLKPKKWYNDLLKVKKRKDLRDYFSAMFFDRMTSQSKSSAQKGCN